MKAAAIAALRQRATRLVTLYRKSEGQDAVQVYWRLLMVMTTLRRLRGPLPRDEEDA